MTSRTARRWLARLTNLAFSSYLALVGGIAVGGPA